MELPTVTVTKDELKVALLENNEKINASIEHSAEKITHAVNTTTGNFIDQVTTLSKEQGNQQAEIDLLKSKVGNIWAKIIGIGAACVTVGGLLGFFIEQVISK